MSLIQLAAILNNLAVVRAKAGNYREAESYCRRALEIRQKVRFAESSDVHIHVQSVHPWLVLANM